MSHPEYGGAANRPHPEVRAKRASKDGGKPCRSWFETRPSDAPQDEGGLGLTFSPTYDFFPISRPAEGAFHERRETRGGMRWPYGAKDVSRDAEAQAAMIRLTGRGSPAEDIKKVRPAMPVNGVCPPGLSQSKPQTPRAERRRFRRFVVTTISCAYHTCAWGRGQAESPAFRAPFILKGIERRFGRRRTPRR
jgi:hypothetical protein